jgi:PAS domain S-box-containing protein
MMPGLDGFGLLRELRSDTNLRDVPVIMLSARASEEARTEGIHAGADDYLTKPFSANELVARVDTTLALQRSRRNARAQLETLLNHAPLGVYVVDADFRISLINPTAKPAFGAISHLIGRDFDEVIHTLWHKPYADEIVARFRHTLETGEPHVTPERIENRLDSGVTEYYRWSIDRISLPDGRFGVVCYFTDISAQVQARNEIAHSEERFRAFVTATSDVVYRMSADWTEMFHLRGRDFIADTEDPSRSWLEKYIHPHDQQHVMAAIRRSIETKTPFELEHRVIRVDGSLGWTFSRAIPILNPQGEIVEWFGTARDVTDRKQSEEAIAKLTADAEQQRRLYQTILASTVDLVYVFDLNHRFCYANQALLTMWGKSWNEAIGKSCLELGYEPWHAEMHDREIDLVIASKQPVRGEVPFTGTHGRRIYDYIFVPVFGGNGEVEAIAGTTRDVTDRKLAEEEIRRANKDLEQFAYTASHDLQEPLRSVKIYTQLLTSRYGDQLDGKALELFDFVRSGANRMEMLVRDLLAYTQTAILQKPSTATEATDALQEAIANLAAIVSETGAKILFDPLPFVTVHRTHLQQLFQNLVGNAIKYRRAEVPPEIHVNAKRQSGYWQFCVSDNGIGIEAEYKEQIFGVFKRLHGDDYSGTGIGLAICQRIVERYHGRIWVESEPGQGSQFYFTIPG